MEQAIEAFRFVHTLSEMYIKVLKFNFNLIIFLTVYFNGLCEMKLSYIVGIKVHLHLS